VNIPTGIYIITSDINIVSVEGFNLIGDDPRLTRLIGQGHAFTTAVININGSADGVYGGFSIVSRGNSNTTPNQYPIGMNVTWTGPYNASTKPNRCLALPWSWVPGSPVIGGHAFPLEESALNDPGILYAVSRISRVTISQYRWWPFSFCAQHQSHWSASFCIRRKQGLPNLHWQRSAEL
jgi:hypothetical protein